MPNAYLLTPKPQNPKLTENEGDSGIIIKMIRLHCKAQTYHWGKKGLETLVGRAYLASVPSLPESAELFEEANHEHYAELWIGDHPNGPAEIIVIDDP